MERGIALLFALAASIMLCYKTTAQSKPYSEQLVGTWHFVELLDSKGKHIDTLRDDSGSLIVTGPELVFRNDGTYSSQYPDSRPDTGTWAYDPRTEEVVLKLYWPKPYDEMAKYIMTLGYAKQDEKGDYYDLIPRKVAELTAQKLILIEKENRRSVFRKDN